MSLFIKGIDKQKRCIDCQFLVSAENDDCILQSKEANSKFKTWDDMMDSCPLIQIPTHGRLGDLDYAKEHIRACFQNGMQNHIPELHEVLEMLDSVPTIINEE